MKIGVQLYTLREECEDDFFGVLEKVAKLGYDGVEFAGFFGKTAEEVKECLEKNNLEVVGSHTSLDLLKNHLAEVITYNKEIGNDVIICPYSEVKDEQSKDELVPFLIKVGKILKENSMKFLYHNHDHEFIEVNSKPILEYILHDTENFVSSELDTFWIFRADRNPVEYMEYLGDKLELVHIKDGNKDEILSVGAGEVDIKSIVNQAKKMGLKWIVVENDNPSPTGMEDITRSINYLKSIGADKL
ncbi:hypothetical protein AN640_01595 [Candidatus Epulonipiscium fishelsonii]|uniref:Uncharacterized protein n=1 Tax=Candidatus Epulonipiscium fishelsonii TaxID=77094 RepID=A0ACC8XBA7_9FIRM|nr:hypothetical protein AN640_01595 [Epulopiscium sp. SCG-D08WGA-EpuloA1]